MSQPQIPVQEWEETAACRGADGDVMFPAHEDGRTIDPKKRPSAYRAGLELCAQCDHHDECKALWERLGRPGPGIWFGTVPGQRISSGRQCSCGRVFEPRSNGQKHCGTECARKATRERKQEWERRRRG